MTDNTEPRRRFLQQIVAVVPATTLAGSAGVVAASAAAPAAAAPGAAAPAAKPYAPLFFNDAEWKFLQAAVDRLIPADDNGPGALVACVPEFIDRQMDTAYAHGKLWYMQGPFHPEVDATYGHQSSLVPRDIYRHGIAACDAHCKAKFGGKAFADLDHAGQEQVLKDMEGGKLDFDKVPARMFFSFLWQNTKEGFFSDPQYGGNRGMVGWKMIGFPGARGDFLDWPAKGNVKYPYGPVSIAGEKG